MPEDLSLRQRLAGPSGAPTTAARLAIVLFACLAFVGGFLAHSGAESRDGDTVVRVEKLAGDVPAAPTSGALELSRAAALPALQSPRPAAEPERPATLVEATATATPEPTAKPTPAPAPTTVAEPPPAPAAPAPPAPPAPAPPAPTPAPAPTFDSSG